MTVGVDVRADFWSRVDKNGPIVRTELGPCWIWKASAKRNGYGSFRMNKQSVSAHVASLILAGIDIPPGHCALHRCDMPCCVNPAHLFVGTKSDNARDMYAKGRRRGQESDLAGLRIKVAEFLAANTDYVTLDQIRAAVGIGDDHQQNVQLAVAIHRLGREVEKRPAGFRRRRA